MKKHFSKNHNLSTVMNKNTLKISYSCVNNMEKTQNKLNKENKNNKTIHQNNTKNESVEIQTTVHITIHI